MKSSCLQLKGLLLFLNKVHFAINTVINAKSGKTLSLKIFLIGKE